MDAKRKPPNSSDDRRHQDEEQETQNRRPDTNNNGNTNYRSQRTQTQTTQETTSNDESHTEDEQTEPYFGDVAGPTDEEHFRVGAWNVDNLPVYASDSKNGNILKATQHMSLDALLMQEVGINWSLTPRQDGWQKRIEDTFERNSTIAKFSHNSQCTVRDRSQWGGTGIFSQGKLRHYSMGAGGDTLGRWTWARYRGKGGIVLRLVSIYQPCPNKTGQQSVCCQHRRHLQSINDDTDPRAAFTRDLGQALQE